MLPNSGLAMDKMIGSLSTSIFRNWVLQVEEAAAHAMLAVMGHQFVRFRRMQQLLYTCPYVTLVLHQDSAQHPLPGWAAGIVVSRLSTGALM